MANYFQTGRKHVTNIASRIISSGVLSNEGFQLLSDIDNTGKIFVGNETVTSGNSVNTDGFPLSAGDSILVRVSHSDLLYAIANPSGQSLFWMVV